MPENCLKRSSGEQRRCGKAGEQRAVNHSAGLKGKHLTGRTGRGNITFLPVCPVAPDAEVFISPQVKERFPLCCGRLAMLQVVAFRNIRKDP